MDLELLKRTRMYKGYQQYEVAEGIGLTRQTYNYKENGKSSFNIDEIIGIVLFIYSLRKSKKYEGDENA